MPSAFIDEIFASVQGEGVLLGQRHIFVRFLGCDLRCSYCDTPEAVKESQGPRAPACRAQISARSFDRELLTNPLSSALLSERCERLRFPGPSRSVVSLTGGEPLLQQEFLAEWLPTMRKDYHVLLETNGIHHSAMASLARLVDFVSMDIKLPSSTSQEGHWEDHGKFLAAAAGTELFVKAIITRHTSAADVLQAAQLVASLDGAIPFVLQPASGGLAPEVSDLLLFQGMALDLLSDVRVIPQVHRSLGLP